MGNLNRYFETATFVVGPLPIYVFILCEKTTYFPRFHYNFKKKIEKIKFLLSTFTSQVAYSIPTVREDVKTCMLNSCV